jgi:hypothetical protein
MSWVWSKCSGYKTFLGVLHALVWANNTLWARPCLPIAYFSTMDRRRSHCWNTLLRNNHLRSHCCNNDLRVWRGEHLWNVSVLLSSLVCFVMLFGPALLHGPKRGSRYVRTLLKGTWGLWSDRPLKARVQLTWLWHCKDWLCISSQQANQIRKTDEVVAETSSVWSSAPFSSAFHVRTLELFRFQSGCHCQNKSGLCPDPSFSNQLTQWCSDSVAQEFSRFL